MTPLLFALLYLSRFAQAQGVPTGTSPGNCLGLDGTTRSVWSILAGCALTLLVCAWHTLHFPVPQNKWQSALSFKGLCLLGLLFTPEAMIAYATQEWWTAYEKVLKFREKGYEWSMTHSFFGQMGGFVYRSTKGSVNTIDCDEFLELCEQNKIANPHITSKEIKDKSKVEIPAQAVLAIQLVWFILQIILRGPKDMAVPLVELDTVCISVISLIAMFLWRHKPLRPECPYVFYPTPGATQDEPGKELESPSSPPPQSISAEDKKALSDAWKPQPFFPDWLIALCPFIRKSGDEETGGKAPEGMPLPSRRITDKVDKEFVTIVSLCVTWIILGGLHLIAWNFAFPTRTEKIIWRVASLILAAGPLPVLWLLIIIDDIPLARPGWRKGVSATIMVAAGFVAVVCRMILLGLMFASLRALPCTAYQVISWTLNIPHL